MTEVVLLVVGAVIGAVGSTVGAMVTSRADLVRTARARMHRDMLPELVESTLGPRARENTDPSLIQDMYREAVLARASDRRLAETALNAWQDQAGLLQASFGGRDPYGDPIQVPSDALMAWNEANQALLGSLTAFDDHLRRKLAAAPVRFQARRLRVWLRSKVKRGTR